MALSAEVSSRAVLVPGGGSPAREEPALRGACPSPTTSPWDILELQS